MTEEEIKKELERIKKLDETITRLLSIMTEEEKKFIPEFVHGIIHGSWSPATKMLAVGVLKQLIGEDEKMLKYHHDKATRFWKNNPEIHF